MEPVEAKLESLKVEPESLEVESEPPDVKLEPVLECPEFIDPEDLCDCNPEFAVICSFIKQFGQRIDIELDIEQLKSGLENQDSLDDNLIDIHVKLLKKLRRYFVRDQWEKALIRYAYEYSYEHGRQIELLGYIKTRPSIKLQLLRRLLDAQFECDQKFKAVVNADEADELRNQPLGRDIRGNIYWHCEDKEGHLRVYTEEPLDHRSWKLLCKDTDQLDDLINELDKTKDDKTKGGPQTEPYNPYPEIYPEYFVKPEKEIQETEDEASVKSSKMAKKGRRGRISKKSSPTETEDLKPDIVVKSDSIQHKESGPNESETSKMVAPPSKQAEQPSRANSIESQVKLTLDSIISKVATKFDFFFRRNSSNIEKKNEEPVAKPPPKRTSKRQKVLHEELPRRTSSRIQQLQQKKITEYVEKKSVDERVVVAEVMTSKPSRREIKTTNISTKLKKGLKKDKQRWKTKGKKKLSWDKDDSDLSSTSSLTDSNDESFVEELNGALNPENVHDSDEFACEEEETNDVPVIIKRARTARQIVDADDDAHLMNGSIIEEDKPCGRCDKSNDPDWILLCDICDDGYHTACCIPPLMFVPDGDWFCLSCEHNTLLSKLRDISSSIKKVLAEKESERQKRQRLRQAFKKSVLKPANGEIALQKRDRVEVPELNAPNAVQDLDEILGQSSGQELSDSYRERAYKQPKKRKKKAKPARNKRRQRYFSDEEDDDDVEYQARKSRKNYSKCNLSETESEGRLPSSELSDDGSQLKTRKARACVSYRFQEYDELIKSAIQADSDEPMSAQEDSPAEDTSNYGRGKDMATIEAIAYQQENGMNDPIRPELATNGSKKSAKTKKKGRRLNDLDAESEIDIATSDDSFQAVSETEDEVTEIDTEDESSMDEIVRIKPSRSSTRRPKPRKRDCYESDELDDVDESEDIDLTDESDEMDEVDETDEGEQSNVDNRHYDSNDSDDYQPRSRRSASKKISYKESTDEEDAELLGKPAKHLFQDVSHQIQEPVSLPPKDPFQNHLIQTLHSKDSSETNPTFYREDEVRPPTTYATGNDNQEHWQ